MGVHGRIAGQIITAGLLGLLSVSVQAKEVEAVPGEYIVKLKNSVNVMSMQSLGQSLHAYVKSTIPTGNLVVVKRPVVEMYGSAIKSLSQNPNVEYVEPNYIYRAEKTPNDPDFGKLWGLKNIGQTDGNQLGISGVDIDVEKAWDITTGSDDVLVAVIDTGVDYTHPDLAEATYTNEAEANGKAGVDDDKNGYVDDVHGMNFVEASKPTNLSLDDHGHGSHCSGTIGARGNDGKGIVGVNWNVKILPVKFLSKDGGGSLEGAIKAIDYATKMKARIMSNSWGGGGESQALKEAIQRANAAGALFIAAAGNDSANNDQNPHFPSNYNVPNVVSVAALDNKGNLASFSNYGKKTVHVAAPGVNVYSTVVGGYDSYSGTSMATPHVSGVAALIAAAEPNLTNLELKSRLVGTTRPMATMKSKVSSGGLVNAYLALTNQMAPPDANDPANWTSQTANYSTPHPYNKGEKREFEIRVAGAKEIALYFSKFDTERGYDLVKFYDAKGAQVGVMSGNNDESYSQTFTGDYVKVVFTADDTVNKYGFDISKISYR